MNSVAIVLNGTSSAGKTSIAKAIQRQAPTPVIHAQADTFFGMFDWPAIVTDEQKKECFSVCVENFHANLCILATNPFLLVVDHVFEQHAWFEACQKALQHKNTYFIGIHCPLAILEERELARGDRGIGIAKGQFDSVHLHKPYSLELDSSVATPDECASAILQLILNEMQANPAFKRDCRKSAAAP
jgi:chloramphenicol 3-O phosphotransferase